MVEIKIGSKTIVVPSSESPCEMWRVYFNDLKEQVGKDNAKPLWLLTWAKNGSTFCTTNPEFNSWLSRNGIDVSNAATRAIADISKIGSNWLGLGKNLTKVFSVGIPIVAGAGLLIVLYVLFRKAQRFIPDQIPSS